MKLKNPNEGIPGGLWYQYEDENGNTYTVNGLGLPFDASFIRKVSKHMINNNIKVPSNLQYLIEQQICLRNPSRCWEEAGDKIANVIHKFAVIGDKIANNFGVKSEIATRTQVCQKCKQRKDYINQKLRNK